MPTPARIPAPVSALTALSRWRGCAVEGSVFRQTSWSSVGIENVTETSARLAASVRTSMSRTIMGPRVMIENGVEARASSWMQPRVKRYRPSAGW